MLRPEDGRIDGRAVNNARSVADRSSAVFTAEAYTTIFRCYQRKFLRGFMSGE
jgi:hypothetical protein